MTAMIVPVLVLPRNVRFFLAKKVTRVGAARGNRSLGVPMGLLLIG